MKILSIFVSAMLAIASSAIGQARPAEQTDHVVAKPPLDARVERFDITGGIVRDGISELSLKNVASLHLGFEELIRRKIQDDPRPESPHFSVHLQNKTVREVLDEICSSDPRYAWSEEGVSVNIYPRATTGDSSYLLNLRIDKIIVNGIPDPDQALTPLSKLFPEQQVGYAGSGLGENTYAEPWTAVFDHLTVRQFIDRIAEHMGPRTSWVWQGGKNERMFTFLKGGFHTQRSELSRP
jgi:hypothetical protein